MLTKGSEIRSCRPDVNQFHFENQSCICRDAIFSFLVGVIGTAYGIGGGSFMVPLCLAFYGLPVHAIAGATLTATFLTSGIALAAYVWLPAPAGVAARPDWWLGLAFGVGGLVGAYLGARCQRRVPQHLLKGFLALLLSGLALRYVWPGT